MKAIYLKVKKTLLLVLILITMGGVQSQAPDIDWAKAYGGSQNDYCFNIKQTPDGGFILVGSSNSNDFDFNNNYGSHDARVVKVDASGEIEWTQNYGGSEFDRILDFAILENNAGYVFLAQTLSNDNDLPPAAHTNAKIWLFQTDISGTINNDIVLGSVSGDFIAVDLSLANDGDYVVLASFMENIRMIKVDNSMNSVVWQKEYGGSAVDVPSKFRTTIDGGYIVIGYSGSNDLDVGGNYGEYDVWVFKTNEFGTIEWSQNYGGSDFDYGMDITQTSDGGYLFAGHSYSNDNDLNANYGASDLWAVKINSTGEIEWQKNFGGSSEDQATAVHETPAGSYLISGISTSNDGDVTGSIASIDYWVLEIEAPGNLVWQKSLGGTNEDISWSSALTNDGGLILAGQSNSNNINVSGNHGLNDFWVVKLESFLSDSSFMANTISLYPNPVENILHITSTNTLNNPEVFIYSMSGRLLIHTALLDNGNLSGKYELDVTGINKGVYLLNLRSEGQSTTYKFIKN